MRPSHTPIFLNSARQTLANWAEKRGTDMTNKVTLIGALVRAPEFKTTPSGTSVFEGTLAGERPAVDENGTLRMKPWYVRFFALGRFAEALQARGLQPGAALYAPGCLDYNTFDLAERTEKGSTTRVKIEELHAVRVPWAIAQEKGAFRMKGGVNEAELSGNLTRDAVSQDTTTGQLTRATLGVTMYSGSREPRRGYFDLKGWRGEGQPLMGLPKGAGVTVKGPIITEPYPDPKDPSRRRTAVLIEVERVLPFIRM
ncbi:single-stranded DNA-binding protein [Deinococcus sp. S9]|nr:single-stranded DNA-binding protein [Deinococcus sp. S9]